MKKNYTELKEQKSNEDLHNQIGPILGTYCATELAGTNSTNLWNWQHTGKSAAEVDISGLIENCI